MSGLGLTDLVSGSGEGRFEDGRGWPLGSGEAFVPTASFNGPTGIDANAVGTWAYVADRGNDRIRKCHPELPPAGPNPLKFFL